MVDSFKLTLNSKQLDFALNNPQGIVGKEFKRRGVRATLAARRQVGVDTGRLRSSIRMRHYRVGRYQVIEIVARSPYALAHHRGTRPHLIRAKDQQMLRFRKGGRIIYTRQVMHPGTKANKYLTDQFKFFLV